MAWFQSSVYLGICLSLTIAVRLTEQKTITLEDILVRTYPVSGFSGAWISDNELVYPSGMNQMVYNVATNTSAIYFDGSPPEYNDFPGSTLTPSADGLYVLITHSRRSVWRHSFLAKYVVVNVATKISRELGPDGAELQLVRWSPVGNALVYVYQNNIYYKRSAFENSADIAITQDGTPNGPIINGHTDWVYEEEMFGTGSAIWFAPNGKHFAFVKFNDTDVHDFEYAMYGEPGNRDTVYPEMIHVRYPKSGQVNPTATVYVCDLENTIFPQLLKYPDGSDPLNRHYISSVSWRSNLDELVVIHMNRRQQIATWFNCVWDPSGNTGYTCEQIWEESETAGWIDANTPKYSADGSVILTLSSAKTVGAPASYRHIIKINVTEVQHINSGAFHVDSILGWDEANEQIYFSGTGVGDPSEAQVYSMPDEETPTVTCITCNVQNGNGEVCQANSASFSKEFTYFLHSCSGPGIPETAFRETAQADITKHVWVNNDALREALVDVDVPTPVTFFDIPLAGGAKGRAKLFLPPNFDTSKKYPLFIDVYGGPDSQSFRYGFGINWGTSLASDKNVIYGVIDGRGSGRQTREHLFELNNHLGGVEIEDQIAGAKWLIDNTNYIDPNRTAIWGWSYGGYATAMVMSTDTAGVFKCGISVAPVTSWLYYDTIYTERYMGTPVENSDNYNISEVTTHVENFRNKQFFLVHGNADDNVHYQQSMILSRALEQNDIMFYQLSYPDEAHGINGPGMNRHLYHSLEKFLFHDCFPESKEDPPVETPAPPTTGKPDEPSTVEPNDPSTVEPSDPSTVEPNDPSTVEPNDPSTVEPNDPSTVEPEPSTVSDNGGALTSPTTWLTGITISILLAIRY